MVVLSISGFSADLLRDATLPLPNLRRLAREGAAASAMTPVDPTVSWPNHASLVTGVGPPKHGVLYNGLLVRHGEGSGVRVRPCSRSELLKTSTLYDLAHEAGMTTAEVGWVPGQAGGTMTWGFGEISDPKGEIEREMIQAGTLSEADLEEVARTTSMKRDDIWFKVAVHVITQHRPGMLLVRLTDLDAVTHRFGTGSPECRSAATAADQRVAGIEEALNRAGLGNRMTLWVVSDQGFKNVARHIRPNAALREAGLLTVKGSALAPQVTSAEAQAVTGGGSAMVFLLGAGPRTELRARVRKILGALEGVQQVLEPSGFKSAGFPDARENEQTADLILLAKPGYGFIAAADGKPVTEVTVGSTIAFHGFPSSDPDLQGIFIAWGRGVRPGAHIGAMANLDVAPTIAHSLGLRMEAVDGRILKEILR